MLLKVQKDKYKVNLHYLLTIIYENVSEVLSAKGQIK